MHDAQEAVPPPAGPALSEAHRRALAERYGVDAGRAAGLFSSVTREEASRLLGFAAPSGGLYIAYPGTGAFRIRFDAPLAGGPKYAGPRGGVNELFLPPDTNMTAGEVWLTEGELKALCAAQRGANCAAVGGIWNWKTVGGAEGADDEETLLPALNRDWSGRCAVLWYDSDIRDDHPGRDAFYRLAEQLYRLGAAEVRVLNVPVPSGWSANAGKVGLDDYIVFREHRGFDALADLRKVAARVRPYLPTRAGAERYARTAADRARTAAANTHAATEPEAVRAVAAMLAARGEVAARALAKELGDAALVRDAKRVLREAEEQVRRARAAAAEHARGRAETAATVEFFPLAEILPGAPHAEDIQTAPTAYEIKPDGVFVTRMTREGPVVSRITRAPVYISHRYTPVVRAEDEGIRFKVWWRGPDEHWRSEVFQASQVVDAKKLTGLADAGLPVSSQTARELAGYFGAIAESWRLIEEATIARCGWDSEDCRRYFLAGAAYTAEGREERAGVLHRDPLLQDRLAALQPAGDEEVQRAALLDAIERYPKLLCLVGAVAAGPLMRAACAARVTDVLGIVVEVASPHQGRGKSASLETALSLLGHPQSLILPANATVTGVEVAAATFSDAAFALEEFQATRHMSREEAAAGIAYMIALGQRRMRADVNLHLRGAPPFHTVVLLASERSILSAADKYEGMKHRIFSITPPFGEAADMETAAFVERLRSTLQKHHGWPATRMLPALIRDLRDERTRLLGLMAELRDLLRQGIPDTDPGTTLYHRSAATAAVVATGAFYALHHGLGLQDTPALSLAIQAGHLLLEEHRTRLPHVPLADRALAVVADFIARNTPRIAGLEPLLGPDVGPDTPRRTASEYIGTVGEVGEETVIALLPGVFKQLMAEDLDVGELDALRALAERGYILRDGHEHLKLLIRFKIPGTSESTRCRCVVFPRRLVLPEG